MFQTEQKCIYVLFVNTDFKHTFRFLRYNTFFVGMMGCSLPVVLTEIKIACITFKIESSRFKDIEWDRYRG